MTSECEHTECMSEDVTPEATSDPRHPIPSFNTHVTPTATDVAAAPTPAARKNEKHHLFNLVSLPLPLSPLSLSPCTSEERLCGEHIRCRSRDGLECVPKMKRCVVRGERGGVSLRKSRQRVCV